MTLLSQGPDLHGFMVGDQVRCINVAPANRGAMSQKAKKILSWLRLGKVYQVRTVGMPFHAIQLEGDGLSEWEGFSPWRFEKVGE